MAREASRRSTREVVEAHLRLRRGGELDADLRANYAEDVAVLTSSGVRRGREGVRQQAEALASDVPADSYGYDESALPAVHDGADSYLVRDGQIVVQMIHYSVRGERRGTHAGLSRGPKQERN